MVDKYNDILTNLQDWIMNYFEAYSTLGDVAERLAGVPEKATECTKNAPSEFAELEFQEKSKMIKAVATTVSRIKDRCEDIIEEMKSVKTDIEQMNDSFEQLQADFESE